MEVVFENAAGNGQARRAELGWMDPVEVQVELQAQSRGLGKTERVRYRELATRDSQLGS